MTASPAALRLWGEVEPREVVSESLAERWPEPKPGDKRRPEPLRYVVVIVR